MPATKVAIGLVWHAGRIAVGRRPAGASLAGLEEFPGGKCLPDEAPADAVVREVREETGLAVRVAGLRDRVVHVYAHGTVELFFFDCEPGVALDAEPTLAPPFHWRQVEHLSEGCFPEANRTILEAIRRSPGCQEKPGG